MPNFPSFNHNCWNLKVLDSHKFKYVQQALKLFFNLQKSTNILNDLEIWLDFQFSSFLLEIFWILLHCQHVLNLCISWICIEYWENVKTASLPLFSMYFTHQYLCLKKLEKFYKILFSCHWSATATWESEHREWLLRLETPKTLHWVNDNGIVFFLLWHQNSFCFMKSG